MKREPQDEEEEEIGPLPAPETKKTKPSRALRNESMYTDNLPCADMYERSLMHRDYINFVHITDNEFLITTSIDGHVKFWKKNPKGIDFVKHFRAHIGAVVAISVSADGSLFATAGKNPTILLKGADKALKIFDIINFDMINMIKTEYLPSTICWIYQRGYAQATLFPVSIIKYNPVSDVVVSVDEKGMIEYWEFDSDSVSGFAQPGLSKIDWKFKSDTDLYAYKKSKSVPATLTFSPDFTKFVTIGLDDRQIRIFNFKTGKLLKTYDESLSVISEMQTAGTAVYKLDDMEFGRRVAQDREIERNKGGQGLTINAVFDESGNFIIYTTLLGIKIVNTVTNKVVKLLGKTEAHRFINIALYQGAPMKKGITTVAMAASDNPTLQDSDLPDPTIYCTAFRRNRFFSFSRREPDSSDINGRDVYNEKPTKEEQTIASMSQAMKQAMGSLAVLHTNVGDIKIKLYPEFAPKAVENFVGLARKGYYDGVIFHRVIRNFMIQTGDPNGDGTGGESLWKYDFEDEFHAGIRHDRPYTVSMANVGPNSNASQFFITTAPTPWLDNKHTIFGRAIDGFEAIHTIEGVRLQRIDKPVDEVKIFTIEIS